jgi:hypothetical protein
MSTMQLISNGQNYCVERQAPGLYRVLAGDRSLGFVERAGSIYVALSGTRYDRAVEAGQALSLAAAVAMLRSAQPERQPERQPQPTAALSPVRSLVRALRSVA